MKGEHSFDRNNRKKAEMHGMIGPAPWLISVSGVLGCISFLLSTGFAAECRWAEGTGSVAADVLTASEAKQLALRQARAMAIANATGIEVRSQTIVKDFMVAGDFIKTLSQGYVRAEHIIRWEQEKYQPATVDTPIPIFKVHLKACVLPRASLRDPEFIVNAELNKPVYVPGERAKLTVTSSRRAQVAIFNLTADDRVGVYMGQPGIGPPLLLEPNQPETFPPQGVSLVMELPTGQQRTSEAFLVVATKAEQEAALPLRLGSRGSTISLTEFYAGLSAVEADVVEAIVPYSIIGR
jgi:hypothetical protein